MDQSDPDLLPEGLEDRLPREAAAASTALRAVLDAMASHGYRQVSPALIEFERSLAARMSGIGTRRMVRFVDPASLRMMAIRADITPQIGRIAETRLKKATRPLRLSYAGPVVTIRPDGLDPARERLQCGAEIIGTDSVAAACEAVAVAVEALSQAGARDISVDFTLPDLVAELAREALPLDACAVAAVGRELDAKDAGGLVASGGEAYLPLLYATGEFETAIERLAALAPQSAVVAARIAALREIAARIDPSVRLTLDPTERHGFEYQTWFGFTLFADGVRGIIGRGGTYRIAGSDQADDAKAPSSDRSAGGEPATGFSLYLDSLIDQLVDADAAPDRLLFLPLGHDAGAAANFREAGWRTLAALDAGDDARRLKCTHRLDGQQPIAL